MLPYRSAPSRYGAPQDFGSLSVRDLLDAREAYHLHLSNLAHVVGTAIGRYRIRKGDWFETNPPNTKPPESWVRPEYARDLFNSVVTPWSWPCVLVFVDEWLDRKKWKKDDSPEGLEPDQFVPRSLYLPDGRVVPTCVVRLKKLNLRPPARPPVRFPKEFVGGGYPVFTRVQGSQRMGSVGCLVTDGHNTYALTNRHVTGEDDETVSTVLGGQDVPVGTASKHVLGKRPFDQIYEPWPGRRVFVNMDVGLVKVNDLSQWTTQVLGLGRLSAPIDLHPHTISLDLIDKRVRAFGAVSGPLSGKIAALFYRYQEMGGFEYVSDLLIAPNEGSETHPGDSGTLWCLAEEGEKAHNHPIALEWGGEVIEEALTKKARAYTLATFVSTILRELELDLVRDWNTGLPYYWGAMGHYTIAARACSTVTGSLKTLMEANLERISYPDARLKSATFQGLSGHDFVPLADVPDYVWKTIGGKYQRKTENPSHFADMDKPLPDAPDEGKTLLDLCLADPKNVSPAVWMNYYTRIHDASKGTLPFRVKQIYEEMVDAVRKQDLPRFVAAAGVVAHYVGDACQPLHISSLFNGDPDREKDGEKFGKGVHEAYEAAMINAHGTEILAGVTQGLQGAALTPLFSGGQAAALATVDLMGRTFQNLKPTGIVDAYAAGKDLWKLFGPATLKTLVAGTVALARLWQSAWKEGGGDAIPASELVTVDETALVKIYGNPGFVPSLTLADFVAAAGKSPTPPKPPAKPKGKSPAKKKPKAKKPKAKKKA
jgi:hypothetical protein